MTTQQFPIGVILTVTHGKLMCDISECYRILNFMTGDELFTHQLPRASRECGPIILRQHPHLADWLDDVTTENYAARLADAKRQFGETLEIAPLAEGEHEFIDPISELAEYVHPDKIVVVKV